MIVFKSTTTNLRSDGCSQLRLRIAIAYLVLALSASMAWAQTQAPPQTEGSLRAEALATLLASSPAEPSAALREIPHSTDSGPATKMAPGVRCFPTCDPTDGRFLAMANGSGLSTHTDPVLTLTLGVPAGSSTFTLGVFDGDGTEVDALGASYWDLGSTAPFSYTLIADPLADGTGTDVVELVAGSPSIASSTMPNNAWIDFTVATGPEAMAPSGNFFYQLRIELLDPSIQTLNGFKVRADGVVTLEPALFAYATNLTSIETASILYPNLDVSDGLGPDDLVGTTFDGTYTFRFDVPADQSELVLWDGDFDFGSFDGSDVDSDDPDTPGAPFLPPWFDPDTVFEGAGSASPFDDTDPVGGLIFLRSPSVRYDVIAPDGQTFANDNPSANREWEQFRISTEPFDRATMDHSAPVLPPGVWELAIEGVDLGNLNALSLPFPALCIDEMGETCTPLRPFRVGDTVFLDFDGSGLQDALEPGLPGVLVRLLSPGGQEIATTLTALDGSYGFEVDAGTYSIEVVAENFLPGEVLDGKVTTTGNLLTDTVTDQNALDYDFGYRQAGTASGVGGGGFWKNHPEDWPVTVITVGGITYTREEAIALMEMPSQGDKTFEMFFQLVAAKLNVFSGNDPSCIEATLLAADSWLVDNPLGSNVRGNSSAWRDEGSALHQELEDYNQGQLCG